MKVSLAILAATNQVRQNERHHLYIGQEHAVSRSREEPVDCSGRPEDVHSGIQRKPLTGEVTIDPTYTCAVCIYTPTRVMLTRR